MAELKDHKHSCRFCLEPVGHKKTWKITEKIQEKFFKLTSVQLKISDRYSNRTCKSCAVLLYETSAYQQKLVNNQKKLYGFEEDAELEFIRVMEQAKENPREAKIEELMDSYIIVKEERLDTSDRESEKNYNYNSDVDEKIYSDYDAAPDHNYDSEEYTPVEVKRPSSSARSRRTVSKTPSKTVKSNRYTDEQLEKAIQAVLHDEMGVCEAAKKFDIPRTTLSDRVKQHEADNADSDEGSSAKRARKPEVPTSTGQYSEEQLEMAVRAVVEEGAKMVETARRFNVPRQTLGHRIRNGPPKPRAPKVKVKVERVKKVEPTKKAPRTVLGQMRHKRVLSDDPFFCDLCDFSTRSKNDLVVHMTLGHKFGYNCKRCDQKFTCREAMREHRLKSHTEWRCNHCKLDFETRTPWARHMVRHRRHYTCEFCGILVQSHKYKYHIEQHENARVPCTNSDCDKIFKTKAGLHYHLNNFHTTPATEVCPICGSLYSNQKKLKRHMARMHATPHILCTIPGCSYRSTRKEYVAMHMQKHNDIDDYTKMELVRVFKATRINNNVAQTMYAKALEGDM